ncbi:HAD phosphatase [Artomyces pyxidatus]|uniref:HAD phosphatase n=1 Tax=Artomyces pyxidatus TaxID=48021 RepID=A0ACB8TGT7_9AGAM|nr:HAD phosphatase [Artomyces pyxidatus]
MPFNFPGTIVPLYALFNPRLLLPSIAVADIRQLEWAALRKAGYRGAVFDKDNCLTLPHHDRLVPELNDAWAECRKTFGSGNVLIVSNSAGTAEDPGQLQADSVTHHLRAPVLLHASLKPSYTCAHGVRTYFSSLPAPIAPHELVVVGDRVFTDVVLARRIGQPASVWKRIAARLRLSQSGEPEVDVRGPLAIWTTGVWTRESMLMRSAEAKLVKTIESWIPQAAAGRKTLQGRFVKPVPEPTGVVSQEKRPWLQPSVWEGRRNA